VRARRSDPGKDLYAMVSRGLFGWSPPHVQPLTPVSEVSEPPESPSPYAADFGADGVPLPADGVGHDEEDEVDESDVVPPPSAAPFSRLFEFADRFDWVLIVAGSVAAAVHGVALVVYLHYFGRAVNLLDSERLASTLHGKNDELLQKFKEVCG
jgi:ATP-binding cassette, subfamily B (MDR/TAP), member 1